MYKRKTDRRPPTIWTEELVIAEVKRCMDELGIHDRMPTYAELNTISSVVTGIKKFGGNKVIAEKIGVSNTNRRYIKKEDAEPKIKPSKAFEIAKEARKMGKDYADIQKAETLEMSYKIDLTAYEGMKTYAERLADTRC